MKKTRLDIYNDYPNSLIDEAINEWIHDERYRIVLHAKLVDGKTFEEIAEMDLPGNRRYSPKQIQNIVYNAECKLFPHLKIVYHP